MSDHKKLWGDIKEVDKTLASFRRLDWAELFNEVSLRLERTSGDNALAIPFGNAKLGKAASNSLSKKFDPKKVKVRCQVGRDGTSMVYVYWLGKRG